VGVDKVFSVEKVKVIISDSRPSFNADVPLTSQSK